MPAPVSTEAILHTSTRPKAQVHFGFIADSDALHAAEVLRPCEGRVRMRSLSVSASNESAEATWRRHSNARRHPLTAQPPVPPRLVPWRASCWAPMSDGGGPRRRGLSDDASRAPVLPSFRPWPVRRLGRQQPSSCCVISAVTS